MNDSGNSFAGPPEKAHPTARRGNARCSREFPGGKFDLSDRALCARQVRNFTRPARSSVRTRTMCAAFSMFAATALIPQVAAAGNTTICHVPPGNEANAHLINVSENAVPAHLSHGDFVATSCACQATAGASCGANQAPCCAGLKCVADVTGAFSCQEGTSSNPMPAGSACTSSTQCDPLYPCNFYGPGDGVCGG